VRVANRAAVAAAPPAQVPPPALRSARVRELLLSSSPSSTTRLAARVVRTVRGKADRGSLSLTAAEAARLFSPSRRAGALAEEIEAEVGKVGSAARVREMLLAAFRADARRQQCKEEQKAAAAAANANATEASKAKARVGGRKRGEDTRDLVAKEIRFVVEKPSPRPRGTLASAPPSAASSPPPRRPLSAVVVPATLLVTVAPVCQGRRGELSMNIRLGCGWSSVLQAALAGSEGSRVMFERFERFKGGEEQEGKKKGAGKGGKGEEPEVTVVLSRVFPSVRIPSRAAACAAFVREGTTKAGRPPKRIAAAAGAGAAAEAAAAEAAEAAKRLPSEKKRPEGPPDDIFSRLRRVAAPPPPPLPRPSLSPRPTLPPRPPPTPLPLPLPPPPSSAVVPLCTQFDLEALQLPAAACALFDAARDGASNDGFKARSFCFQQRVEVFASSSSPSSSSSSFDLDIDRVPNARGGAPAAYLTLGGAGWAALSQALCLSSGLGVRFSRGASGFVNAERVAR